MKPQSKKFYHAFLVCYKNGRCCQVTGRTLISEYFSNMLTMKTYQTLFKFFYYHLKCPSYEFLKSAPLLKTHCMPYTNTITSNGKLSFYQNCYNYVTLVNILTSSISNNFYIIQLQFSENHFKIRLSVQEQLSFKSSQLAV